MDLLWPATTSITTITNQRFVVYSQGALKLAQLYLADSLDSDQQLLALVNYSVVEGKVDHIGVAEEGVATADYDAKTVLAQFGIPTQVLILTYSDYQADGSIPFYLLLYYPDNSILFTYHGRGEAEGEAIRGCFGEREQPRMRLWPSADLRSINELQLGLPLNMMRPIEDVTLITPAELRDLSTTPGPQMCIETSASHWPLTD